MRRTATITAGPDAPRTRDLRALGPDGGPGSVLLACLAGRGDRRLRGSSSKRWGQRGEPGRPPRETDSNVPSRRLAARSATRAGIAPTVIVHRNGAPPRTRVGHVRCRQWVSSLTRFGSKSKAALRPAVVWSSLSRIECESAPIALADEPRLAPSDVGANHGRYCGLGGTARVGRRRPGRRAAPEATR